MLHGSSRCRLFGKCHTSMLWLGCTGLTTSKAVTACSRLQIRLAMRQQQCQSRIWSPCVSCRGLHRVWDWPRGCFLLVRRYPVRSGGVRCVILNRSQALRHAGAFSLALCLIYWQRSRFSLLTHAQSIHSRQACPCRTRPALQARKHHRIQLSSSLLGVPPFALGSLSSAHTSRSATSCLVCSATAVLSAALRQPVVALGIDSCQQRSCNNIH
mmetsp:Transcript_48930/g.91593  ORF Transcript_48930/g.91593 Transcript_48930/m.91593 type:complete len:213 (-) Transcript_48930:7-645(-)